MLFLLLSLCHAGSLEDVRKLEWARAPAVTLAAQAAGADEPVRVAVAQALGRVHRAEATTFLEPMLADPSEAVRVAAADSLGWTEGAAPVIRAALSQLDPPRGPARRRAAANGVRVHLIEALGRQGDAGDLSILLPLLAEPWPTSAAAADALARLGRRGTEGLAPAIGPLITSLERPDPRTAEAAAHALRRIGLGEASSVQVETLALRAMDHPRARVRAWLIPPVADALEPEAAGDLFLAGVADWHREVRVAALGSADDLGLLDIVGALSRDDDPWVRQAAIEAVARLGEPSEVARVVGEADPWTQALAMTVSGDPLGKAWRGEGALVVRAAALETADLSPEERMVVALDESLPPAMRTAAVAPLLELEAVDESWSVPLLDAADPVVREAAVQSVSKLPAARQRALLAPKLADETDPVLLRQMVEVLLGSWSDGVKPTSAESQQLRQGIERCNASADGALRGACADLAKAAGLTDFHATPPEDPLDGEGRWVRLMSIAGARIHTTAGVIDVDLFPEVAPRAVENFAKLAEQGFYDGTPFHRVVPGFVIQAGCPRADGWGGPGYAIPDEVSSLNYVPGALGMARSAQWDTGGSQWFISTSDTPHLEGDYTLFGQVSHGLHTAQRIERGQVVTGIEIERRGP